MVNLVDVIVDIVLSKEQFTQELFEIIHNVLTFMLKKNFLFCYLRKLEIIPRIQLLNLISSGSKLNDLLLKKKSNLYVSSKGVKRV